MSNDSWTCLMVGKNLSIVTDDLRNVLKAAGCQLYLQKLERMPIKHPLCNGVIHSEWKTVMVGTRSGILFETQFECEAGETQVNFLLNIKDLESGKKILEIMEADTTNQWTSEDESLPEPDLYKFRNLRSHKLN